jgi:hypothetical protein
MHLGDLLAGAGTSPSISYNEITSLILKLMKFAAFEKHAQNGRSVKRATRRASEFVSRLVARIRALCALNE